MVNIPESHASCPVGHATALLGDRWSIMIVREALGGATRYQEFRAALRISDHTLARRLRHLQEIGVLRRDAEAPTRYELTEAGQDLARVLAVLGDWAMKWLPVELPLRSISEPVRRAAGDLGIEITQSTPNDTSAIAISTAPPSGFRRLISSDAHISKALGFDTGEPAQ